MNSFIPNRKIGRRRAPPNASSRALLRSNRVGSNSSVRGMSLVEVLIAFSIAIVVGAAIMSMTLSVGRLHFDSTAKLLINKDVRSFTNQLSRSTRSARIFEIYASESDLAVRESGESGDVLALVWAQPESIEDATMGGNQEWFYEKIIIFARVVEDEDRNIGPVMLYERDYALPSGTFTGTRASQNDLVDLVAAVIANSDGLTDVEEVVELTRGLSEEKLFFHSRVGKSITVNGELYHGNDARRVTNTFNFTIAPRG
jgi:hypothetical protein